MNKKRAFYLAAAVVLTVLLATNIITAFVNEPTVISLLKQHGADITRYYKPVYVITLVISTFLSYVAGTAVGIVLITALLTGKDKLAGVMMIVRAATGFLITLFNIIGVSSLIEKFQYSWYLSYLPQILVTLISALPGLLLIGVFGKRKAAPIIIAAIMSLPAAYTFYARLMEIRYTAQFINEHGSNSYINTNAVSAVISTLIYIALALICIGYSFKQPLDK